MKRITFIDSYLREQDYYTNDSGSCLFELWDGALKQLNCESYPVDSARRFAKKLQIPLTTIVSSSGFDENIGVGRKQAKINREKLTKRQMDKFRATEEESWY